MHRRSPKNVIKITVIPRPGEWCRCEGRIATLLADGRFQQDLLSILKISFQRESRSLVRTSCAITPLYVTPAFEVDDLLRGLMHSPELWF